jgi:hypothetical protein
MKGHTASPNILGRKKNFILIAGVKPGNSCRSLFKTSQISALPYENMLSLMNFTVNT